jgi:eukaryotic-like serine/threonine-protein kinase
MGVRDDDPTLMGSPVPPRVVPRGASGGASGRAGMAGGAGPDAAWPGRSHLGERYRLDDVIASGGAAIVWRAFDEHLARPVAVKLLHPHHAGDATVVERFQREARAAAALSHPNVVRIYDTGRDDRIVWLVMELVQGPSLRDVLQRREPLDAAVVAAIGEQVARALAAAHDHGLVHRDIKPGNILIADDGTVKVTDFGIAKALSGVDETLTNPGTVMGTAAYVAPEQLEGVDIDARADVYALGVVLYEALVGRPAFSGDTPAATAAMRLTYELLPPRRARPDVPDELDEIVTRATRRDRSARYVDGREFAEALTPLLASRPSLLTARLLPGAAAQRAGATAEPLDASTGALARPGEVRRLLGAGLAGLALAVAAITAVSALRDVPSGAPDDGQVAWPVTVVRVFDPTRPDLDLTGELALAVVDGDAQTVWSPGVFPAADLGEDVAGIGLLLDLGQPRDVRAITLQLVRGGADVSVLHADVEPDPRAGLDMFAAPLSVQRGVRALQRLEFAAVEARYWLVWVTGLSQTPAGTFTIEVADVTVLGPG